MKKEQKAMEERLEAIKNLYNKLDDVLGTLLDVVSDEMIGRIRNAILDDADLKRIMDGIPVSSQIDWGCSNEEIENMDIDASAGLMMAAGLNKAVEGVAMQYVKIFGGIAASIAVIPIPFADMAVLTILQAILVIIIGHLAGEDIDIESAKKFLAGLFGVGLGANVFKLTARQLSKLIPKVGSSINAEVAYNGTYSIGVMAVQHYIYGTSMSKLKTDVYFKEVLATEDL